VLAVDCDLSAVHQALQATRLPARSALDRLAHRALALTREHPPATLATLGGFRLPGECAAAAFPFAYMRQSAQAQNRLAHSAASTSDSTPSNKRAAPAPPSAPPSTPRPRRTTRDRPHPQQLRCSAIRPLPCRAITRAGLHGGPRAVHLSVFDDPQLSLALLLFSEAYGGLCVWQHVRRSCTCRLCSDRTGKEPMDNWELSASRWRGARLRRLLRASAAAAACALGAMVVQIAFEAPDAADSLLERWIECVTGDIL
jgi:hypothetical protein